MQRRLVKQREYYAGALMMLVGGLAGYVATTYEMGDLAEIGPGFFPLALSVLLVGLGVAIVATAGKAADEPPAHGPMAQSNRIGPDWRGWAAIFLAVVAFIVLGAYAGLAAATFCSVFIAAMGDRSNSWKSSGLLALGLTVFAIVVLAWGLRVQMPVFGRL